MLLGIKLTSVENTNNCTRILKTKYGSCTYKMFFKGCLLPFQYDYNAFFLAASISSDIT